MRRIMYITILTGLITLISSDRLLGQEKVVSLARAYQALESRYPLLQNAGLIDQRYAAEQARLKMANRPRLSLQADGRLQSQTTAFPDGDGAPPIAIDLPLYSSKAWLEIQYNLLDGGRNKAQQAQQAAQHKVEKQSLAVDQYQLRRRINQLFVQIHLNRAQIELLQTSLADLKLRQEVISVGIQNGVILESELSQLKVRELELASSITESEAAVQASLDQLNHLTGLDLAPEVQLIFPNMGDYQEIPSLGRPEQELFQHQAEVLGRQTDLLAANRKPQLSLYAQSGGGYPNPLNLLDNQAAPFALAGFQFNWQLSGGQIFKKQQESIRLQREALRNREAAFAFDMESAASRYQSQLLQLSQQIEQDQEIAALQEDILTQMAVQLDEGVITSSDYLVQSNASLRARQNLSLHRIQRLNLRLDLLNQRGQGFE
ncbi:MAG: TolC family protein [Bacteroidota bacterium]